MLRSILCVMVLSAMAMPAYAYNLTNDCDDNLREGDRAALDTAVEFLDVHRADVFAEIERDSTGSSVLSAPNLYDYTMITPEEYDAWSGEIDDLLYSSSKPFGEVRIACHYSGDNKYCDASTLRGGRTKTDPDNNYSDRVHLCMDNLRLRATGDGTNLADHLVNLVAHELYHHVDRGFTHPEGVTIYNPPDSDATTLGLAAQHAILSPALRTTSIGLDVVADGVDFDLTVEAAVGNYNPNSVVGGVSLGGYDRNTRSNTCLLIDGERSGGIPTDPLPPFQIEAVAYQTTLPYYKPGFPVRTLEVMADCFDSIAEIDEADNVVEVGSLSTEVDFAIDVALAKAPQLKKSGRDHFYRVTYEATVTNLDNDTPAPAVDVLFFFDDMWTGSTNGTTQYTPILDPGESTVLTYTVDVPTGPGGTGPTGTTRAYFRVDSFPQSVHDSNWDNNTHRIDINSDYWRPDYRIASYTESNAWLPAWHVPGPGINTIDLEIRIENIGPEDGTVDSTLDVSGTGFHTPRSTAVDAISSMSVSAPVTVTIEVPWVVCGSVEQYTVSADFDEAVAEIDETNNTDLLSFGRNCPELASFLWPEPGDGLVEETWYGIPVAGVQPVQQFGLWETAAEYIQWVLDTHGNGPFLPTDWERDYVHTLVEAGPYWGLVSQPSMNFVYPGQDAESAFSSMHINGASLYGTEQSFRGQMEYLGSDQ